MHGTFEAYEKRQPQKEPRVSPLILILSYLLYPLAALLVAYGKALGSLFEHTIGTAAYEALLTRSDRDAKPYLRFGVAGLAVLLLLLASLAISLVFGRMFWFVTLGLTILYFTGMLLWMNHCGVFTHARKPTLDE